MKKLILVFVACFLSFYLSFAQTKIYFSKKNNPNKQRKIDFKRAYHFQTASAKYYGQIIDFTKTTISVLKMDKENKSLMDTVYLPVSDILIIKKDWFKNTSWLELFSWAGYWVVSGIVVLPVVAALGDKKETKQTLLRIALGAIIATPAFFIATRKTCYDLRKKWDLKIE